MADEVPSARAHPDFQAAVRPLGEREIQVRLRARTGQVRRQIAEARVGGHPHDLGVQPLRSEPDTASDHVQGSDVICASITLSSGVPRADSFHTSRASISRDTLYPWWRTRSLVRMGAQQRFTMLVIMALVTAFMTTPILDLLMRGGAGLMPTESS